MAATQVEGETLLEEDFTEDLGWRTVSSRKSRATTKPGLGDGGARSEMPERRGAGEWRKGLVIKNRIVKASRMPPMPEEHIKIVIRPRGGLNLEKTDESGQIIPRARANVEPLPTTTTITITERMERYTGEYFAPRMVATEIASSECNTSVCRTLQQWFVSTVVSQADPCRKKNRFVCDASLSLPPFEPSIEKVPAVTGKLTSTEGTEAVANAMAVKSQSKKQPQDSNELFQSCFRYSMLRKEGVEDVLLFLSNFNLDFRHMVEDSNEHPLTRMMELSFDYGIDVPVSFTRMHNIAGDGPQAFVLQVNINQEVNEFFVALDGLDETEVKEFYELCLSHYALLNHTSFAEELIDADVERNGAVPVDTIAKVAIFMDQFQSAIAFVYNSSQQIVRFASPASSTTLAAAGTPSKEVALFPKLTSPNGAPGELFTAMEGAKKETGGPKEKEATEAGRSFPLLWLRHLRAWHALPPLVQALLPVMVSLDKDRPASFFRLPYYDAAALPAYNFAGLGQVIARAFVHRNEEMLRHNPAMRERWNRFWGATGAINRGATYCLVTGRRQNDTSRRGTPNGTRTSEWVIRDQGPTLKLSYLAFLRSRRTNTGLTKPKERLAGIRLSREQLFLTMHCALSCSMGVGLDTTTRQMTTRQKCVVDYATTLKRFFDGPCTNATRTNSPHKCSYL
ncbi:uncharacterized protein LOC125945707 [Dermacentor silvarum]|uniref:uncharacterized protein LOC125945707 n=1 Tax=Dermacentor silvarum TaxID=543639 RepID=UPI002100EB67|nr:uncharacterized protein LOC125945707 [Dermacentor silvarum]